MIRNKKEKRRIQETKEKIIKGKYYKKMVDPSPANENPTTKTAAKRSSTENLMTITNKADQIEERLKER